MYHFTAASHVKNAGVIKFNLYILLFQELFFKPQPAMQHNNTVIYLKVRVTSVTRVRPHEAQDVDPSHLREVKGFF